MDLFTAIRDRRSCRAFSNRPVEDDLVTRILECAIWAPSPLNSQPWEFVVVSAASKKEEIFDEAERYRAWAVEASGWKWLQGYEVEFLKQAAAIVAVSGDPKKTGVDMFQEGGTVGYQHACAAAVQNMLLAAHALGLGGLWFTLFDRGRMRGILDIAAEKVPLALVCLGRPADPPPPTGRKGLEKKVRYIR